MREMIKKPGSMFSWLVSKIKKPKKVLKGDYAQKPETRLEEIQRLQKGYLRWPQ